MHPPPNEQLDDESKEEIEETSHRRKETGLGELTTRFISMLKSSPNNVIDLNLAAT